MRNQYYLLRHGKTIYQTRKKGTIYPCPDSPKIRLTKEGEREVKKLAKKIKKLGIDLIYSSDFFRTKQTAEIVAKELGLKVKFDKLLRDVNLGIYHGRKKEEFYKKFPGFSIKRFSQRPVGGESWKDCQKRMLRFLKKIDKKLQNKTILIVSHGDPLWFLEGGVKRWSFKKLFEIQKEKGIIKTGELRKL